MSNDEIAQRLNNAMRCALDCTLLATDELQRVDPGSPVLLEVANKLQTQSLLMQPGADPDATDS